MGKGKKLLTDSFIIGAVGVALNLCGVWFNLYLKGKLGTEGLGLFSLISSAYMLAASFATSGINLSVTRIITEDLTRKGENTAKHFNKCLLFCGGLGLCAGALLYLFAHTIAFRILDRPQTEECFRILSFGLPFMSLGSCLNGFFTAERKAYKTAVANGVEEFCKIGAAVLLFTLFPPCGIAEGCRLLVIGLATGEGVSCFVGYCFWLYDKEKLPSSGKASGGTVYRLIEIGAPVAVSSYIRTGLTTVENLAVPVGLVKYGMTDSAALSLLGGVKSLAVPVIFFPASFMYAFIKVMIPEVTEAYTLGRNDEIREKGGLVIRITLVLSSVIMGIFTVFYAPLGNLLFEDKSVSRYLLYLAPLIPWMYVDGVADGILKGMNEQVAVMRYNIYEALIRVVIVFTLIPVFGFAGFIITVYAGNVINTAFSCARLRKRAGIEFFPFKSVVIPSVVTLVSGYGVRFSFLRVMNSYSVIAEIIITLVIVAGLFAVILCGKREYSRMKRRI